MGTKAFGSVFHVPFPAFDEPLLTFVCINNGISAFWRWNKNISLFSDWSRSSLVKTVGLGFKCEGAQPRVNIDT